MESGDVFAAVLENRSGALGCCVLDTSRARLSLYTLFESSASCVNALALLETLQPSAVLVCAGGSNLRCCFSAAAQSGSLRNLLVVKQRSDFDDTRGCVMVNLVARPQDKVRARIGGCARVQSLSKRLSHRIASIESGFICRLLPQRLCSRISAMSAA